MSARHVGHPFMLGRRVRTAKQCPLCRARKAKKQGRLRIEQRARERRAWELGPSGWVVLGQRNKREWKLLVYYGAERIKLWRRWPDGTTRRLSKHQRGRTARRNRRGA